MDIVAKCVTQSNPDRKECIVPGSYAHITLVNLAREPARLDAGPGLPNPAALALGRWLKHCELGAVSPDYPYLAIGSKGAAEWADLMHYQHTGDMVKVSPVSSWGNEIVAIRRPVTKG